MSYTLEIRYADRPPETRTFEQPVVIIGRDQGDISMRDPQVSGRHAELRWDGSGLTFRDLGSSNGSFDSAGQRLYAPKLMAVDQPVRLGGACMIVLKASTDAGATAGGTMMMPAMPKGGFGAPPPGAPPSFGQPPGAPPAGAPPQYGQPPGAPPSFGQPPGAPPQGQYGQPPGAPPQGQYGQPPGAPPQGQYGQPPGAPPQAQQPAYGQAPPQAQPPAYGQPPQQAQQPAYGQAPQQAQQPAYGQAPQQAQQPAYEQAQQPAYGQAPPQAQQPAYGQPQPGYAQPPQHNLGQEINQAGQQLGAAFEGVNANTDFDGSTFKGIIMRAWAFLQPNLVQAVLTFGAITVGIGAINFVFGWIPVLGMIMSLITSLIGLVAGPLSIAALGYFVFKARIGQPVSAVDAWKTVVKSLVPLWVNFAVAGFIAMVGSFLLVIPGILLGFFIVPMFFVENKRLLAINFGSLEWVKRDLVKIIVVMVIIGCVMVPIGIVAAIFSFIFGLFSAYLAAGIYVLLMPIAMSIVVTMMVIISVQMYCDMATADGRNIDDEIRAALERFESGITDIGQFSVPDVNLGAPPQQQGGYGQAPQQQGGYAQPQQQQGGYGQAPQQQGGYAQPQQGGYGQDPQQQQQQGGYGQQPQQGGYGQQPQQGGYGQQPQQGYPPPQQGQYPPQQGGGNWPQG